MWGGGTCDTCWRKKNACRVCAPELEGKRILGRPKRRCKCYTKMDLVDKAWTEFICLRDKLRAVVNMVMNLRVP